MNGDTYIKAESMAGKMACRKNLWRLWQKATGGACVSGIRRLEHERNRKTSRTRVATGATDELVGKCRDLVSGLRLWFLYVGRSLYSSGNSSS